jgi:3-oxoacyl-[acyl-carrier protein] reductase
MNLKEAKVLVTGGSTGIGFETAKQLKAQGATVVICSKSEENLQKAMQELQVVGFQLDVANEAQVVQVVADVIKAMNGLNVLINNAGIAHFAPLTETNTDFFTEIWDVNVKGAFLMGRECAKYFVTQNTGNIINIASTAAQRGFAGGTAYCASKFALSGMTECWRAELRKHNVRVMQVNPSEVITPFNAKVGYVPNNVEKKLKPSEIAHVISSMLALNDIGFITDTTVWATNP